MDLVSFKLPATLRKRLADEARRRRVSQGALIRESLEAALRRGSAAAGQPTCADLAGDLAGAFRGGPSDLSTNKRYLDEAIVADYLRSAVRRGKKRRR